MSAPWLKWYPSDWRSDPALRVCSIAARGLWMEMLCVMHEGNPRGYLNLNGLALTNKQLSALVGAPLKDVQAALVELEVAGVYSRDNGVIFSRRMVRDTEKAARDKENGKGGGNPALNGGVNPPDKPRDKAQKLEARTPEPEPEKPSPAEKLIPDVVGSQGSPTARLELVPQTPPELPAVLDRRPYPDDYEEVWREYRFLGLKTASKFDGHRAFAKLSAADKRACYAGVIAYVVHVTDERKKREDYPVKHLSTFIQERGWESFLEDVA